MIGTYGCYEALDLTPAHLPHGHQSAIVRSYMAHHQGMLLAALDNCLRDHVFVRRFHADPRVHAAELLLHERAPLDLPAETAHEGAEQPRLRRERAVTPQPWTPIGGPFPAAHVLGNGRLSCVVTASGAGVLRWQQHTLTRGTFDPTCEDSGLWIYVRDEESGALWSAGRQPTGVEPDDYSVSFDAHMAEIHRRDHGIVLRTEVAVSATDDVEIRYLTVANESGVPRRLTITSYGEVVLAPAADDDRHPAFSKLFVSGEYLRAHDALLFTRRPRSVDEHGPLLMHRVLVDGGAARLAGFETDRARFLGRNACVRTPRALEAPLSGTVGTTLDTIMSMQVAIDLKPGETAHLAFVTLVGGSRESLVETADRFGTLAAVEWMLDDAATEAGRELRQLGIEPSRLPEIESLLSILLYAPPVLRGAADVIAANRLGQPRLWGMGVSGDLPILLVRIMDEKETGLVEDLVRAHRLWRRRGVGVDLVLLWEGVSGYEDTVTTRVLGLLRDLGVRVALGGRGGIHLVSADHVSREERQLLEATAHAILTAGERPLAQQLADMRAEPQYPPPLVPAEPPARGDRALGVTRPTDLQFDNGIGGFTADGREYVICLAPGERTPAPWSNVLANSEFGTLVSEAGGGYTWSVNCAEHRLTPWRNDPVSDAPTEALYLRDEETAQVWTPTPSPAGSEAACEVRHGAGYTTWAQWSHDLEQTLTVFVPLDEPVKVLRLRLINRAPRPRRITLTYYAEWVLGTTPGAARPFVVTEYDATNAALLARSAWNPDFAERVAFVASDRPPHGFTTDRREFIGREGDLRAPAALSRWGLSGTTPPGCDPCAALQVHVELRAGEQRDVLFILGDGRDRAHAEQLLQRWRDPRTAERAWDALGAHWDRLLGAVTVRTPAPAFDVMLNRWLLYQATSARLLGRTGLYQSSGAFGFRDQLQDVMALIHVDPSLARAHIVACAERQFEEGDVLHWWHPPADRGVRTRCSDDLLWLPYVATQYVEATGDIGILEETAVFLTAPPLAPDEHDRYGRFDATIARASLFEHCRRALARGITAGAHGLPLIGTGDWNDALDRVGAGGRGESVWLAWFAIVTMRAFAELCDRRGDRDEAEHWRGRARSLTDAVERGAWDGEWYRRAYDDDGRPWGSASSGECAIDSITQSWAALSGAAADDRAETALRAAERMLVSPEDQVVRLLWPPFDLTMRDPGYIKAYPPGIRENGGQYSHAAAWLGWAFAAIGDGDRAAGILRLINPITHAATRADALRYRVEPYVVAADIGGVPPHVGRGGWTWYTGAAAWTWRLGVEAILGLRRTGGRLQIDPCVPREWPGFSVTVRTPGGSLEIEVVNPDGVSRGVAEIALDGVVVSGNTIDLPDDGGIHRVRLRLGSGTTHGRAVMTAS
jgi:cyclic beta-1,2-glucan synthetase